jgi:hypothetical protein
MTELRIQIIDPLLSTLLQRPVEFALGTGEQLERVVLPLELVDFIRVLVIEVFIFFHYLCENIYLSLLPLNVVPYPAFQQRGQLVFEEIVSSLQKNFIEVNVLGFSLYKGMVTNCYN